MSTKDDFHCQLISELNVSAFFKVLPPDDRYKCFCKFVKRCKTNTEVGALQKEIIFELCSNINILLRKTKADKQPAEKVYSLVYDGVKLLYPEMDISILIQSANVVEAEDCAALLYYSFGNEVIERYLKDNHNIVLSDSYEGIAGDEIAKLTDELLAIKAQEKNNKNIVGKIMSIDPTELEKYLLDKVRGQEAPLEKIINKVVPLIAGIRGYTSIFGVGPTGVGKTHTVRVLAEFLFGKDRLINIDCSQYKGAHEAVKLTGGAVGYIGYDETPFLTKKAREGNNWVFLFDEFEKSHPQFQDALLSLIDTGTITDNRGDVLDFTGSIFFFTSNIGTDSVLKENVGFGDISYSIEDKEKQFVDRVKKYLNPEFSNRLREIIVFNPLSKESIREIVVTKLKKYRVDVTDALIDYIMDKVDYKLYGAREVEKKIEQYFEPTYSRKLLSLGPRERQKAFLIPRFLNSSLSFVKRRVTKKK